MRYTISEMAALLGVTTHTLRYYEKMGLIQPEVNRETGYRYYTVTDTRRFNLCRELRAAGFTLEECKDFLDEPSTAVTDAMLDRQIRQLERRQVLNRMSIRFLQKTREYYHTLEQDAGRVWVQNFPEMWRLVLSQEEEARNDPALQAEKAEWLECMPAVHWVSRLPSRVMEQFRVGRNEYDYGLLVEADAARQLGLAPHRPCRAGVRRRLPDHRVEKGLPGLLRVGLAGSAARRDPAAGLPRGGRHLQQHPGQPGAAGRQHHQLPPDPDEDLHLSRLSKIL